MKSFGYFSYLIPTPMLLFPPHDDPKTLSLEEWYWFIVLALSYLKSLSALPHTLHLLASSNHASLPGSYFHHRETWNTSCIPNSCGSKANLYATSLTF